MHPQYPVNSSFAAGQLASLSCKAKSEFPPELHWLKRLSDSSPPLDGDVEVGVDPRNTVFDNMTPNKTISYGNARYLVSASWLEAASWKIDLCGQRHLLASLSFFAILWRTTLPSLLILIFKILLNLKIKLI